MLKSLFLCRFFSLLFVQRRNTILTVQMEVDNDNDVGLEPQDYVLCDREQQNGFLDHPANKTLGKLIEEHVVSFGIATTADERSTIVARIEAEARASKGSDGRLSRFLVPKEGSSSKGVFREATPEEIKLEINELLHGKFTRTPKDGDVLIYTGESLRKQSHIGNQRLHTFIRSLGRIFPSADQRRGLVNVPRDVVTLRGSDFLIPFNEDQPQDGCIKADDESIERMLALLLE